MIAALGNLLDGVVDYAGLFPPARLEMSRAVKMFATDREGVCPNMLRHFILPATRLSEFDQFGTTIAAGAPWTLSILVGGGETTAEWIDKLDADLVAIQAHRQAKGNTEVKVLEIALPTALAADADSFARTIAEVETRAAGADLTGSDLFFETTSAEHRRVLVDALSQYQGKPFRVGLKLRTGGIKSEHFPSNEAVAEVIELCDSAPIPWKATAGLHHPFPYPCPQIGVTMHGFLNLLMGVVLWQAKKLNPEQLSELISDANADRFVFTDDHVEWNGVCANRLEVIAGRERFISFGSCSFSEPLIDLDNLGLLSKAASP